MSDGDANRKKKQEGADDDDAGRDVDTGGDNDDAGQDSGGSDDVDVQAVIDKVIKRERSRAEKRQAKLEREIAELREALDADDDDSKNDDDSEEKISARVDAALKEIRGELDAEREAAAKLRGRLATSALVEAAAAAGAVNPGDVSKLLGDRVRASEDGTPEVLTDDGEPAYGRSGEPMTLKELVSKFLEDRPHMRRSKRRGGGGFDNAGDGEPGDIRAQISALEAKGEFGKASRLKAKLLEEVRNS